MRLRTIVAVLVAMAALIAAVTALPAGAQDEGGKKKVLRLGWAQDLQTLNPFVGSGRGGLPGLVAQLGPAGQLQSRRPLAGAGHRGELGRLTRQEDRHVQADRGSEVVGRGADHVQGRQVLARQARHRRPDLQRLHVERHVDRDARRAHGRGEDEAARRPDRRRPVHLHAPRAHLREGADQEAQEDFQPPLPMVGSGPYVVTEFERGRIMRMERNPELPRREAGLRRDPVHQVRHRSTRSSARCGWARSTSIPEVQPPSFERLGQADNVEDGQGSLAVVHAARVQPLLGGELPGREVQPGGPGPDRAPGDRLRHRPRAGQRDLHARHVVPGHGILPQYYKAFYEQPADDYPYDPDKANQMLDDAGWARERRRDARRRTASRAVVRPVRALGVAVRTSRRRSSSPSRRARSASSSRSRSSASDKLTEITTRKVDGKPAPDFDTFIWGWGGDPYDPSSCSADHDRRDRRRRRTRSTRTPSTTGCSSEQAGEFDHDEAQGADPADGRDHPARPALPRADRRPEPAGVPDRPHRPTSSRPARSRDGDVICEQVSYAPLARRSRPVRARERDGGGEQPASSR